MYGKATEQRRKYSVHWWLGANWICPRGWERLTLRISKMTLFFLFNFSIHFHTVVVHVFNIWNMGQWPMRVTDTITKGDITVIHWKFYSLKPFRSFKHRFLMWEWGATETTQGCQDVSRKWSKWTINSYTPTQWNNGEENKLPLLNKIL